MTRKEKRDRLRFFVDTLVDRVYLRAMDGMELGTAMATMTRIESARKIVARNMNFIVDLTDYTNDLRAELMAHYHGKIPGYVNVPGLVHGPVHAVDGLVNLHVWGTGKDEGQEVAW